MVLATCRGALRDEHDAEDAFQATFFVLARKADSLRRGDRLGPWLHRVALRTAEQARVATAQRAKRECRRRSGQPVVEPGPELATWSARRFGGPCTRSSTGCPERYRAVVVLCDLQGESYE